MRGCYSDNEEQGMVAQIMGRTKLDRIDAAHDARKAAYISKAQAGDPEAIGIVTACGWEI